MDRQRNLFLKLTKEIQLVLKITFQRVFQYLQHTVPCARQQTSKFNVSHKKSASNQHKKVSHVLGSKLVSIMRVSDDHMILYNDNRVKNNLCMCH